MDIARSLGLLGLCVLPTVALAGPDWVEVGDAGSQIGTVQRVVGVGSQVRTISGSFSSGVGFPDFEDMYLIRITDPAEFRFSVETADLDVSLFLFNVTLANEAFGLLGNLDQHGETSYPTITSMATDDSGAQVNNAGIYALAISAGGRRPVSGRGEIFAFQTPYEISGADGRGGLLSHIGWEGQGGSGRYVISVDGATFVDVPTPGVLALTGLGVAGLGLRRRR